MKGRESNKPSTATTVAAARAKTVPKKKRRLKSIRDMAKVELASNGRRVPAKEETPRSNSSGGAVAGAATEDRQIDRQHPVKEK